MSEGAERSVREGIAAAARGDPERLADLLEGFRPRLERFVELRLGPSLRSRVDPEDVVQDALTELIDRVGELVEHPERDLFGWARFLTGQRLVREKRWHLGAARRDVRRERPGLLAVSSVAVASAFLDGGPTPSQDAAKKESEVHLVAALEALDPIDREVLALRHLEALGNGEVARLLGLSESAASMRYARALQRLRRALRRQGVESDEVLRG